MSVVEFARQDYHSLHLLVWKPIRENDDMLRHSLKGEVLFLDKHSSNDS
jgi:hypothetical protein